MMGPFNVFDIHIFWFALLGVLLTGYAILDGFDLGVGILHLFVRQDEERRVLMSSIGPLWDGNAVWLVVLGGATFAAFPNAYAAAFLERFGPRRIIWGSDFPWTQHSEGMSYRQSRDWLDAWIPDPDMRRQVLGPSAARLFNFVT